MAPRARKKVIPTALSGESAQGLRPCHEANAKSERIARYRIERKLGEGGTYPEDDVTARHL